MTKKEHYSVAEAARALGITPGWLYIQRDKGLIKFSKVGKLYLVTAAELKRYRNNHRKKKVAK